MNPIPSKTKQELADSPYMKRCVVPGCGNALVEWNHALIYSGRQINETYAIVPLCQYHHRGNNGTIWEPVKLWCEWLAITRGIDKLVVDYSKFNWEQRLKYLNSQITKVCLDFFSGH